MRNILLLTFFTYLFSACGSYKEISYFQDLNAVQGQLTNEESKYSLTIRPDDELLIIVSALDPVSAAPFNLPLVSSPTLSNRSLDGGQSATSAKQATSATTAQSLQSYLVDSDGEIHFPGIGKIKVSGMTKDELVTELEKRLSDYIVSPIVNIQIVNFKVSVLGEVTAPGSYTFSKQRVSILEALASAKDMTLQGRRDNVMIIRDINGKKEYIRMDLSKSETLQSPDYYLQQNDIVYVVPNREKQNDAYFGAQKQYNTSIIISAISTVISIIAIITR
ncbi:polysaccharide biosynthesis/export family protein [Viscerimonas tarda]